MYVGVLRVVFHLPGARSKKDKRRAVLSFKDRVRSKLQLTVAEVGEVELLQKATLGVAAVSNEHAHCQERLDAAVALAYAVPSATVATVWREVITIPELGTGGPGLSDGLAPDDYTDEWDEEE